MYTELLSTSLIYFFLNGMFKTIRFSKDTNQTRPSDITGETPKYESVIYILFDGLRYDYTLPNLTNPSHYLHNHMLNFNNLPHKFNALSVCAIPTSTTCRVTGLLTGTPSNFLEGTKTFINERLDVDNMVDQMYKRFDGSVSFYGDRTWLDLCPVLKHCSNYTIEPYSKKNLEVNEVSAMSALIDRIGKDKAILGHFISLDAFGHLYDTSHYELKNSLIRFDNFIKEVYEKMGEDTLLVLTSDHGVNDDGEHGGSSTPEMSSFVSFVSKRQLDIKQVGRELQNLRSDYINKKYDIKNDLFVNRLDTTGCNIVHQDDILPTVCYLLDIPVPKNSYGNVVHELVDNEKYLRWFYTQKSEMMDIKKDIKDLFRSHYELTLDIYDKYSGANSFFLFISSVLFIGLGIFVISQYKIFLTFSNSLLVLAIIMVSHSIKALEIEKFIWMFVFLVKNFKPINILGMLVFHLHDQNENSWLFFVCLGFIIVYSIYKEIEIPEKKTSKKIEPEKKTSKKIDPEKNTSKKIEPEKNTSKKIEPEIYIHLILSAIKDYFPGYIDNREFIATFPSLKTMSLLIFSPKYNMFLSILSLLDYKTTFSDSFPLLNLLSGAKQLEKIDYSVAYVFTESPSYLYSGIPSIFYFVYPRFLIKKDPDYYLINMLSLLIVFGVTYWEFNTMMFYHYFADRCFFTCLFFVIDMVLIKFQ
ncbi:hypothetical protein P3W45_001544 [Vairimorpha bombi]|jgi:GPI ethanolamine phosphate transferase 3 subunit O